MDFFLWLPTQKSSFLIYIIFFLFLVEDFREYETKKDTKCNQPQKRCLPNERSDVLTIQDLQRLKENKPLKNYDAFVLYEDEDSSFVEEIFERHPHYELCTKSDLIVQTFEHTAIVNLIEQRCRRVIAVISKNFLNSPSNANRFLVDFAQAQQVGKTP